MAKYAELMKLKGRITENGETYRSLSKKTGIPLNTLSNKINGHSLFDIVEVSKICAELKIPPEEIPIFSPCVTSCNKRHREEVSGMDMQIVSKKADTLINRMMEACEKEGASLLEAKLAAIRLQRVLGDRIEELEADQPFTAPPRKEN